MHQESGRTRREIRERCGSALLIQFTETETCINGKYTISTNVGYLAIMKKIKSSSRWLERRYRD